MFASSTGTTARSTTSSKREFKIYEDNVPQEIDILFQIRSADELRSGDR